MVWFSLSNEITLFRLAVEIWLNLLSAMPLKQCVVPRPLAFLFDFINRNRKLKHVHIKASVLKNSKHEPYAYQTIIRDITKEHLTEQKLKEQQKVIVTESLILKNLLDNPNVFENGNNIVGIIADYLGTEDCVFYAIIENKIIQVAATNQKLDSESNIKNALQINLGEGIVGKVAQSKKGIIVNNTSKHKDYIVDDQIQNPGLRAQDVMIVVSLFR